MRARTGSSLTISRGAPLPGSTRTVKERPVLSSALPPGSAVASNRATEATGFGWRGCDFCCPCNGERKPAALIAMTVVTAQTRGGLDLVRRIEPPQPRQAICCPANSTGKAMCPPHLGHLIFVSFMRSKLAGSVDHGGNEPAGAAVVQENDTMDLAGGRIWTLFLSRPTSVGQEGSPSSWPSSPPGRRKRSAVVADITDPWFSPRAGKASPSPLGRGPG